MEDKIRKSLRYSTLDGVFASIMMGFSESFITPYALAMRASAAHIGFLASMPSLIGSLAQLFTAPVVDALNSRMALITPCVLMNALMWVPIIVLPYVSPEGGAIYLIALVVFYALLNAFDMPAWTSLMSDHVPENRRGSFFGWRNRLLGFINVGAAFVAAYVLNAFKGSRYLGFTVIFAMAFISRLISWNFLRKMYDMPLVIKDEHRFTFRQFLKRITASNFGRFVIFVSLTNFAVSIFSPFIAVYLLRDLGFDYVTYIVIILASTITMLLFTKMWGMHADHVGNKKVLRLTSFFIPLVPVLWLPSHNMAYLIMVQIFAGFFWSGFNLSAANFILDAVTPEKRTRCIAYFNVINGCAISAGAVTGGFLVKHLPSVFGYKILALAALSGILRIFASILCAGIKEVRVVKKVSSLDLFYSVIGMRPLLLESKE